MREHSFSKRMMIGVFLSVILLVAVKNVVIKAQVLDRTQDTYKANNRPPDERFKADVLVVVAHSDDEIMAVSYLARAIDQGWRPAIVVVNDTGQSINGGLNRVGPERAASLAAIRQIEGLRAAAVVGISNVWNLGGSDTQSQNVLESLEGNDHGQMLGRMVRLVRLTRPEVMITWCPEFASGDNHSDHRASGVLATEAFDLAGDPTAYPEQVSPAIEPGLYGPRVEGLRAWQPKKLYYFENTTHIDFFAGKGPQYNATDISPTRHVSYGEIAAESFSKHMTQQSSSAPRPQGASQQGGGQGPFPSRPVRLILGKSLVHCGVTDDVFAGVEPGAIPFQRAPGYIAPKHAEPVVEIGDPWHFYHLFWQAHGLDSVVGLLPNEISLTAGAYLVIPLIADNPLDKPIDVTLSVNAPDGWKVMPLAPAHIEAQEHRYYLRVLAASPADVRPGWQQFTLTAESEGKTIGTVPLRVQLTRYSFPQ